MEVTTVSLHSATSAGVEWSGVGNSVGRGLLAVGQLFACHQSKSLGTDHAERTCLKAVCGLDYKYLEDTIKILKALRD